MNKPIKFKDTLFSSENSFLNAIKQITIHHIYDTKDEDEYQKIFINIADLSDEINSICTNLIYQMKKYAYKIKYRKQRHDDSKDGYDLRDFIQNRIIQVPKIFDTKFSEYNIEYNISKVLYNKIEDILLTEKVKEVKYQNIRTKMSATNSLLLKVLEDINKNGTPKRSSEYFDELEVANINEQLYRSCYKSQELTYRIDQAKYEKKFLSKKLKLEKEELKSKTKYLANIVKAKNRKLELEEEIEGCKFKIKQQEQLDKEVNSPLSEKDIKKLENADDTADNDVPYPPQIEVEIVEIEELKERIEKLNVELKKLDNITLPIGGKYKEKLQEIQIRNQRLIALCRARLIKECKSTESKIEINKQKEIEFFNKLLEKTDVQVKLYSSWEKILYIPPKKSTAKDTSENIKDGNFCIIDPETKKRGKKDLIFRVLQYLESYNLVIQENIVDSNYLNYTINLDHSQDHPLQGKFVIENILPLLSAYIKFNNDNNVRNFLVHIDSLIEYSWQDPKLFSPEYEKEQLILEAYNKKSLLIRTEEKSFSNISKFELFFDLDMNKVISVEDNDEVVNLKLTDIISIEILEEKHETTDKKDFNAQGQKFMSHHSKYKIADRGESKVVLVADISHSDFFDAKPLKNQIIYKTKAEIKQFTEENSIEYPSENKIFIEAVDTQDKVIYVVKRSIPHVKILEPTILKEKFDAIIKSMCDKAD